MLTKKEVKFMKILKIEKEKAFYIDKDSKYQSITDISKNDLKYLIRSALFESEVEMDTEETVQKINNEAERIIYNDIKEKLNSFLKQKELLLNEVDQLFKDSYEKYKEDLGEKE
jgi:hypothetical protein